MSATLSAILDVKNFIQDRDSFLNYLSHTATQLRVIIDTVPNYNDKKDSLWSIAKDFKIGNEYYFVLENTLGFSIDYNPNDSIAILCLPCSWQKFCTDLSLHDNFKNCSRVICNALGGDKIIYFSGEEESGIILNLFYPDTINELVCTQSNLDGGLLQYDLNVKRAHSIKKHTDFIHPNMEEITSYLNACKIKENDKLGPLAINGYFFDRF